MLVRERERKGRTRPNPQTIGFSSRQRSLARFSEPDCKNKQTFSMSEEHDKKHVVLKNADGGVYFYMCGEIEGSTLKNTHTSGNNASISR